MKILKKVKDLLGYIAQEGGGGYSGQLWLGMCCWPLKTLPHYSLICGQLQTPS